MPEGLSPQEIDDVRRRTRWPRRGPLPPRRGRAGRARRRPRGHPGPVRGVRGRRVGGRRRARPPRLHRRGADDRPAHPRRGARVGHGARQGHRTGRGAAALVASLRARLDDGRTSGWPAGRRPRVLVLEWTDPPFAPGHWVPEMVARAGGETVLGTAGERSVRITWEDVARPRRRSVVCAPCGYGLERLALAGRGSRTPARSRARGGVGRRRQRVVRPPRAAARRRGRGAGRDPAPGVPRAVAPLPPDRMKDSCTFRSIAERRSDP